ncbi:MAG: hypothetical protein ACE149_02130 [Armatimonadota bacterium]
MRTFSEGRLARTVAYALSTVFLWSVGFMGLAVVPASAQIVVKGTSTQTVAVVPFQNRTKLHPETLGDEASAAVSVELRDRLLLDVLPKADVSLQMRDLGMTPPLSDAEMVRLTTELDVQMVVAGEVRGARIVQTRQGRYAEIVLLVRLFDRVARADVNGALVSAISPTSDQSDEVLIEKALQQAAFSAIEQMKSRPTVAAMVLWSRGDTVFLNVGTRGGVRPGMKLVAVRGGERIGLAKVTEADAIGSYATSVEGPPLRTGDSMRAVWVTPTGLKPERVGVAQERRSRFENLAIAAGVLLGFGNYASRARRTDEGNTTAPGFQACSVADGADMGISGYLTSFNPTRDLQPRPAAIVKWNRYQSSEKQRILGYWILRGGGQTVTVLLTAITQDTYLIDTGLNTPGLQTLTLELDEVDGRLTTAEAEFTAWDPSDYNFDLNQWENPTWGEFVQDNGDQAILDWTTNSFFLGWFPSELPGDDFGGMFPSVLYFYQIGPLTIKQDLDGFWEFAGTEFSTVRNFVTGVAPAGTYSTWNEFTGMNLGVYREYATHSNPSFPTARNLGVFRFYFPFGADQMQLQLARSPNFSFDPGLGVTNVDLPPSPPAPSGFDFVNSYYVTPDIDLSQVPGVSTLFLWRVRARSTSDSHPAQSLSFAVDNIGDPNLRGWVHSTTNFFDITATASRASLMHEERAAMEAIRAARARVPRTATTNRVHRTQ